jgi:hypothetical protein
MDFDIHDMVGTWVAHGLFISDRRPGGLTDELACSLHGDNHHCGTPINLKCN